ncbi:MAG: helix-turn-helix transcriptional regulator [Trueperella sp.]|nr:helix-turn-helix transcriptional regulator [Trueperella sp.]
MARVPRNAAILTVSVAAELAGMHAQTVRQYDRLGLVVAKRTRGGGRRYSLDDVAKLQEIQRLSQEEGINLAGIARIFQLKDQVDRLQRANDRMERELGRVGELNEYLRQKVATQEQRSSRVFAADTSGGITVAERWDMLREVLRNEMLATGQEVVLWRPRTITVFPDD